MPVVLEAVAISKSFPGVRALDGVSVTVRSGEVVAIVGENGAGKSTLMKVLAGVYQPDGGELRLDGQPVRFRNPADALRAGVALIHQELSLAENLSATANLFLGREVTAGGSLGWLRGGRMASDARRLAERVGLPPELLDRPTAELSPGQKQLVEIARALGSAARVIIMDEPTSSLTHRETERLYEVIDSLRAAGVSVLYISHRLAEVTRCADRAVVLRDGQLSGELPRDRLTHENLVRLMVGRDLTQFFPRTRPTSTGRPVLRVAGLRYAGGPNDPATFEVRAGEVLGMAGLVGAGRTELAEAVFGLRAITAGTIHLDDEPIRVRNPKDAIRAGIMLVPEDRRLHGLVLDETVGFNLSLTNLGRLNRAGWVLRRAEAELHRHAIDRLRVKPPDASQTVGLLSGGNQQKVVFGKWLARGPKVFILDEPTRGVDVGAKAEIYGLIDELAGQGVAVWMITSDMEELLGVSDRVVVLHEGRIAGDIERAELTEEAVMHLATGGGK